MHIRLLLFGLAFFSLHAARAADAFHPTACEGIYPRHLQGICTDGKGSIYWCWTDTLVKTDRDGRVLKKVAVASHHGDPYYHAGRVYVAVNLGKFNEPAGAADSWVYVYDGDTLAELAKHRVPEVAHGAGGMEFHDGKFIVIGGLPPALDENYLYEYPFELYLDYGVQMKSRSPAGQTFLTQLAAGSGKYLPTPKAIEGGSYSAMPVSNRVGPEGGQMLVEETVRAIRTLWPAAPQPAAR
jgi:hypothetical protein